MKVYFIFCKYLVNGVMVIVLEEKYIFEVLKFSGVFLIFMIILVKFVRKLNYENIVFYIEKSINIFS